MSLTHFFELNLTQILTQFLTQNLTQTAVRFQVSLKILIFQTSIKIC